jgi:hypothetical protein
MDNLGYNTGTFISNSLLALITWSIFLFGLKLNTIANCILEGFMPRGTGFDGYPLEDEVIELNIVNKISAYSIKICAYIGYIFFCYVLILLLRAYFDPVMRVLLCNVNPISETEAEQQICYTLAKVQAQHRSSGVWRLISAGKWLW